MILYIGNNLKSKLTNQTTLTLLSNLLRDEGYLVKISSSINNPFLRLISMLWAIITYRRKTDYVLIDTYSTKNFYYALVTSQLCRILKLKYIPILHGGNLPYRLDKSQKLSKLIFMNSYINVAVSKYLEHEFDKRGYKSVFIPNVLEIENYTFQKREISTPKLLYVRAFASIYNPEMAIKVLYEVKKEYPDALLCMVGPEKDNSFNSCKALAKKFGIENSIEFTGMLPKKEWHEKSKDYNIFINTTNIDNAPVSVIEAMALGLPIVSTNVGGLPFLIENNNTGILVNKNDIKAMANAISSLCKNQETVNYLTMNARKQVNEYDWSKVKTLWHNILQ
ncbi:glycosyltransferase family 4 protein [Pontimicrobium aquaticum]|uniref:Glycosyltransferase n=1 Tax=Pontimicrobium aquaticum TaxID=2565367 RepID=A0A4U0ERI8_9FLAO|nr:glycosyltransferase [Pontimicrobium aquaticum]TJY32912.1 glycosyltransferase [Pontimicrobium aquaticum]